MITTTLVTSKDGVGFSVSFYSRNEAQARLAEIAEARFARTRLAVELESFGDYHRVSPLTGYVEAPAPRISSPQERRAAFRLIQGGILPSPGVAAAMRGDDA
jgi:hypothetical protein